MKPIKKSYELYLKVIGLSLLTVTIVLATGIIIIHETIGFTNFNREILYLAIDDVATRYQSHPTIKSLSYNITKHCDCLSCGKEEYYDCAEDEIFNWVHDNIGYQYDSHIQDIQDPIKTLQLGTGDCEDIAILTKSLLLSIGIDAKVICGEIGKNRYHCWAQVIEDE